MPTKPVLSRVGFRLFVAILIIAGAAALVRYTLRPVARTALVYKNKAVNAVPGSVTVQAEYVMELRSESEGRVISSELDPGKKVKLGEVLAQIDPSALKLEIEHLQSEYEAAKNRLAIGSSIKIERDNAKDALDISEHNYTAGGVSLSEITKQRRSFKIIEQRVALEELANKQLIEGLENTLKVRNNVLKTMTVTAPFDGVVSAVVARPGDLLGAKASLATLISTSRVVEAKISEENFTGVDLGQKATVRFLGYNEQSYQATVIKMLPTADAATQRYVVHLEVAIDADRLVPGITGEVSIVIAERDGATLIPRRALFAKDNVYVVVNGRVERRRVELGYMALNAAEIIKGLTVGDQVIVEELDKFRDGDRVQAEVGK